MNTQPTPIEFLVPDMSCGHCVGAITRAVKAVDADAQVACDLPTQKVRVQTRQPRSAVVEALAEAGYTPA